MVLPPGAGVRRHQIHCTVREARWGVGTAMRRSDGPAVGLSVGRLVAAVRSAGPPLRLNALPLLAACQPQARRLPLLALALSDHALLNCALPPSRDEGYAVETGRFYPPLAR